MSKALNLIDLVYCSDTVLTVRHRGMETELMETILRFASVSPRKMETLLLGSWWP